jgi:CheY-like chemotaxis protein
MLFSSHAPREVLIVDDDLDAREALAELLEYRGFSVGSAANGREALNYLRSSSLPGIIILDLMMPMMDGWEFLEHQSRDFALMEIPVIVLTATPPLEPIKAKAILQKPIHLDSLVKLLNHHLCLSQHSFDTFAAKMSGQNIMQSVRKPP